MKTITFLMPMRGDVPIGGYKIVFEYANIFVEKGYNVNIVYPAILLMNENSFILNIKYLRDYVKMKITKQYLPDNWFKLDKRIKNIWVPFINKLFIPKSDYIIATAWQTAEILDRISYKKEKKIYLIQHFEEWSGDKERVINTWKMKLNKIVIASWLKNIADKLEEKAEIIPNPMNFKEMGIDIPIERREDVILMMYSENEWKGSDIGIKALEIVRQKYKDIKVIFFSAYKKNENIPEWVEYYEKPKREKIRELYNKSIIYLGTSYKEGWGLPVSEAMQCGCAVVCTDIDGYNEVAFDEETAVLSNAGDFEKMAENIIKLLIDREKMAKIANNGNKNIQKYNPETAYKSLEKFLLDIAEE